MGLFDLFKKNQNADEMDVSAADPDPDDVVFPAYDAILEKSHYGDRAEKLNPHERVILVVRLVEDEVNNGGFSQFIYNSSGSFAGDVVASMTAIGAVKTAEICQRALSAFGTEIPVDREVRQALLDQKEEEGIGEILDECDDAFYAYEEDLIRLCCAYILAHKDAFDPCE